jgi:hypothetical protein
LPTAEEKRQVLDALNQLTAFLGEVQGAFERLPSAQDADDVKKSLEKLETLQASVDQTSALATFLKPRRSTTGSRDKPLTEPEKEKGAKLLDSLMSMRTESVDLLLGDDNRCSWRDLRAVAFALGIRSSKGFNRDSLAHQISTKVANARGYRVLRGDESLKQEGSSEIDDVGRL